LESDRLLLNGVSLRFVFIRAKDYFALMGSRAKTASDTVSALAETSPKLKISDASLFVRQVKLSPAIMNAHARALQVSNAIYPIKRRFSALHNLAAGQAVFNLDNIIMGQMPEQLILGLVEHDAHLGNYFLNPVAFKHNDLNYLCVYLNGESYPRTAYTPDYSNDCYEREYYEFIHQQGLTNGVGIIDHSYKNFKEITNLYFFNFSQDFSNEDKNYINLSKEGTLRVELRFANSLAKALKLVCLAKFDISIEIDINRNIITDF
jgi:hypothetical protein